MSTSECNGLLFFLFLLSISVACMGTYVIQLQKVVLSILGGRIAEDQRLRDMEKKINALSEQSIVAHKHIM
jgi:hypothetical protein